MFELWGIIAHFNPAGFKGKRVNLAHMLRSVRRQGLKVIVVEGIRAGQLPEVSESMTDIVVHVVVGAELWQKERLLNIGLEHVPRGCEKVAWLDSDVLFANDDWVLQTARLLERFHVVQPFSVAAWCKRSAGYTISELANTTRIEGTANGLIAAELANRTDSLSKGHTGFAWAARCACIAKHGFYDRLILGGADTFIAAAALNIDVSDLMEETLTPSQSHHLKAWMAKFAASVGRNVTYVPGTVYHLWHGDQRNRSYRERHLITKSEDFDPIADIALNADRTWTWATDKPLLHGAVSRYFQGRLEDET